LKIIFAAEFLKEVQKTWKKFVGEDSCKVEAVNIVLRPLMTTEYNEVPLSLKVVENILSF
jgi:hypothetical protein